MGITLADNVQFLLADRGMTQRQLSSVSGVSLNTINRWCNGRARRPSGAAVAAVARALEVSPQELLHEDLAARAASANVGPADIGRRVPVISDVPAGDPVEVLDDLPVGEGYDYVFCPAEMNDPNAFALRLNGDSLEPRFSNGDVAIVSPNRPFQERDLVVAKITGESVTCKYIRTRAATVTLSPGNPQYAPRILHRSEIRWIYPVVYVIKKLT